ncbi:hypothetical protein PVAP13_4KG081933 [Panicum virgatum]|uniref:Uncharacterized protein n=1 Tax=Panicum virgatum TaxID=38727 RepID=A0A8T0TQ29_PANVG|nr:hypothetical protein PVAP13_4KG081933 [Panicum virgatum]
MCQLIAVQVLKTMATVMYRVPTEIFRCTCRLDRILPGKSPIFSCQRYMTCTQCSINSQHDVRTGRKKRPRRPWSRTPPVQQLTHRTSSSRPGLAPLLCFPAVKLRVTRAGYRASSARYSSARLVLQTSQYTSSAQLAKELEPARLAREPKPKTHFRDILELELGSGAPLLYPIGDGSRKRRRVAPASRARRAVGEQRNRARALLAADLLCRAGAAASACAAQAEG